MNKILRSHPHAEGPQESSNSVDTATIEALDGEAEAFEGRVSEVAQSGTAEEWNGKTGSQGQQSTSTTQGDDTQLTERQLLRDRLLKNAPKAPEMRRQVQSILEAKKITLEKNIDHYKRKKEYDLLSQAIMQLRALVRQMEAVAEAGYELLREIWLKVVHKFA